MEKSTDMDENEERGESLSEFVREQVDRLFIENLPFEYIQELPPAYMYYFGSAAYAIAITMFVYFTYYSYEANADQAYISLSQDPGCESVPISITGNYYADQNGNWVGTPDFADSKALYLIAFSNFEITTNDQYVNMMNKFYSALQEVGSIAVHNTIAENLILWMIYKFYYSVDFPTLTNFDNIGYGQLQSISMTGNPMDVFKLPYIYSRVGSKNGICNVPSLSSQDSANHILLNSYGNYSSFKHNPACSAAVNPVNFGYHNILDDNVFRFQLDTMSFATAMGVNLGYLSINNLRPVQDATVTFNYAGVNYTLGEYFNSDYYDMASIFCMQNTTHMPSAKVGTTLPASLCFIDIGSTLTLPVFNHFGANEFHPEYCSCSSHVGKSKVCQSFDLLTSLMFFVNNNDDITFFRIQELIENVDQHNVNVTQLLNQFGVYDLLDVVVRYPTYKAFNKASYNASYWVSSEAAGACTGSCLQQAFSFCNVGVNKYCSLFTFNVYDFTSHSVSNYKYQLSNGSCANTFTISPNAWNQLINNPPVQFTQLYFECFQDDFSAFVGAIGIAVGNTQLGIPFVILAVLPFLYMFLVCIRQVPPKEEYNTREKEEVIEIFSLLLLRLRDGKTRGIKRSGVLMTLAKELITAAKEEGGYPDSDDEEEEDSRASKMKYRDTDVRPSNWKRGDPAHSPQQIRNRHGPADRQSHPDTGLEEANPSHPQQQRKNVRKKMAVFTKHLKNPQNIRGSDASRTSSFDASNGARMTNIGDAGNTTTRASSSGLQFPIFSAILSLGKTLQPEPVKQQELLNNSQRNRVYRFPDDVIPVEIKLLNLSAEWTISLTETLNYQVISKVRKMGYQSSRIPVVKELSDDEVDLLIDDLTKLFSEGIAISSKKLVDTPSRPASTAAPVASSANSGAATRRLLLAESTPDSDDEEEWRKSQQMSLHSHAQVANDLPTQNPLQNASSASGALSPQEEAELGNILQRGQLMSQRFMQVNLQQFLNRDDQTIYLRLFNIIIMHASIEMNRSMTYMSSKHSHQVAYVIGNQVLTAQDVNNIL